VSTVAPRRVDLLEDLARARFGDLSQAEVAVLRAAPRGELGVCGPPDPKHPHNDPAHADDWGADREIRAELIRWLCVDAEARTRVDPRGILVLGAKIAGELDLSFACVPFPLRLMRCRLTHDAKLNSAEIPSLALAGTWVRSVRADRANVSGNVFLREGFSAEGEVRLLGAQIGGNLECTGGTFKNPPQKGIEGSGKALAADRANVRGDVFLREGFSAEGEVRLLGAQIGGDLACMKGRFKNAGGEALNAERAEVKGDVFLSDGFTAEGEVRLLGTQIDGNLECAGGRFNNPPQEGIEGSGKALSADGANVTGSVFLSGGFRAEGEVRLLGAQIGVVLACTRGTFKNPAGDALSADGANVKGSVFLSGGFSAEGEVRLLGAQIGGNLECTGGRFTELTAQNATVQGAFFWRRLKNAAGATLDLSKASVGAIADQEASWPERGKLFLDGFVYQHIAAGPTGAPTRLKWLDREQPFTLQPFRQLAKVLRETGDARGAREVLYETEHRRRKEHDRTWHSRLRSLILRWTIGYGLRPLRALVCLGALTLAGFGLFYLGYFGGAVVPTDEDAYKFLQGTGYPPAYYPRFHAFAYSLENSFPLVSLGQKDHWTPKPEGPAVENVAKPQSIEALHNIGVSGVHPFRMSVPGFLRYFLWFQIVVGWTLAAFFVAGLTRIVRVE
jgi:hypothetical protein